jgi:hypothetical protein
MSGAIAQLPLCNFMTGMGQFYALTPWSLCIIIIIIMTQQLNIFPCMFNITFDTLAGYIQT